MSGIGYGLYAAAPVWMQNIAVSLYGRKIVGERYGGDFEQLFRAALERTYWDRQKLDEYREAQWESRIRPVLESLPAYRDHDCSYAALSSLPYLSKAELRADLDRYTHPDAAAMKTVSAHTSGTTGAGLNFLTTPYSVHRQWAYWWRYRDWHGITRDEWSGVFGGREVVPNSQTAPPYWRVNSAQKSVMFSQYHLSPERGVAYIEEIRRRGLRWLHGYPSILALLARIGIEAGLEGTTDVEWVTLGAESLLAHQSELIRRMFNTRPLQHYGLAEATANISLCPSGKLHVDEDFSVVEFVPVAGRSDGHRLIGSTLDNEAMPLIRYDTGDIVHLAPENETCDCGRSGRIVRDIDGRQEDYLVLSDGTMVGRTDHLFKDATAVAEAQVYQRQAGVAVFRIVRRDTYTPADEQALLQEVANRFGDRLDVSFDYVTEIPKTSRGKLRFVINEIQDAGIAGA